MPTTPQRGVHPTSQETRASSGTEDAISLLEADHRIVERLFDAFERADADDLDRKGALVQRACEELTMHAMIEEELLYPAARDVLRGDKRHQDEIEESYVEHFLVKTLIEKFTRLRPGDEGFDATFRVLAESVKHHVEEEEHELFPVLRKTRFDLGALGRKIAERKAQLQARIERVAAPH